MLLNDFRSTALRLLMPLSYLAVLGYAVVDTRPAAAATVLLSVSVAGLVVGVLDLGFGGTGVGVSLVVYVSLVLILPVGAAAWVGARRQVRLRTPDAVT